LLVILPFSNENDSCYSVVFASKLSLRIAIVIVTDPGSRASLHSSTGDYSAFAALRCTRRSRQSSACPPPQPRLARRLAGPVRRALLPAAAQTAAINAGTAAQEPARLPVFPEIVVNAKQDYERRAGTKTVITSEDLERRGVTDMGGIVRYQPLISTPMAASGAGSVWDRATRATTSAAWKATGPAWTWTALRCRTRHRSRTAPP
jgi:hypothetical protein